MILMFGVAAAIPLNCELSTGSEELFQSIVARDIIPSYAHVNEAFWLCLTDLFVGSPVSTCVASLHGIVTTGMSC